MSKQDCLQGNWQQAGYHDSSRGNTSNRFELRTRACAKHGMPSNKASYLLGYKEGLQAYCQPDNAIEAGMRNHDYRGICPAELKSNFIAHYLLGLKVARNDLRNRYRQRDNDLHHARFRRLGMAADRNKEKIDKRIDALSSRLDDIRTQQLQITRKILRWQSEISQKIPEPPNTQPDMSVLFRP